MNRIQIQKIEITNFKGIRSFSAKFAGDYVSILGRNGAGKTTIADAICWVFTGCVYDGRAVTGNNVYIQPKENGKVIMDLPHIVTIYATLNGEPLKLQREAYDHRASVRGSEEKVFDGFENKYYWNDVKIAKSEYDARLKSIHAFSLTMMNPSIFARLPQANQREILMQMAGEITWDLVAGKEINKYQRLLERLKAQDMESLLAELRSAISQLKESIEIKTHQAEGNLLNIFKEEIGEEGLKKQLAAAEAEIQQWQSQIDQSAAASSVAVNAIIGRRTEIQREISELKDKAAVLADESRQIAAEHNDGIQLQIRTLQTEINELKDRADSIQRAAKANLFAEYDQKVAARREADQKALEAKMARDNEARNVDQLNKDIAAVKITLAKISAEFEEVAAEEINGGEPVKITCPDCGSVFETEESKAAREALVKQQIDHQTDRLNKINKRGVKESKDLEAKQTALSTSEKLLAELTARYEDLQTKATQIIVGERPSEDKLIFSEQYRKIQSDINIKEKELADLKAQPAFVADMAKDPEYQKIQTEIQQKNEALAALQVNQTEDVDTAKARHAVEGYRQQANELKATLARYANNALVMENDDKLKQQIKTESAKLAEIEQTEVIATELNRARFTLIEEKVNRFFKLVRFQMFERCLNGSVKDKCQAIVNGVEIIDANNADKINGGVDICYALQQFSGVQMPIIVDNAESVTELLPVDTQVIRLVVADGIQNVQVI